MLRKLVVVGLILTGSVFAQRGGGGGSRGGGNTGGTMPMSQPSKFDQICNYLNLNKDQKKAVKTLLDDAAKDAAPLRDQMSKARIAIADAVQAKKSDDEVSQAVNAYAALAAQMTSLEINTFAKIHNGLDDTQKANRNGTAMVFAMMKGLFSTKNWNED